MRVILKSGYVVPVPKGYSVDRVLEILRDMGHEPAVLKEADKADREVA